MPTDSDTGFIINKYPYSETSLIVIWLSKNHGIISTVARGVYKQGSSFTGKIDLFYLADFEFRANQKSDLHSLTAVSIIDTFNILRTNLTALNRTSYAALLIQKLVEKDTPVPDLFDLFLQFLTCLSRNLSSLLLLQFEIILLSYSGELKPHDSCSITTKFFIQQLISSGKIMENPNIDNKILGELHSLTIKSLPENQQLIKLRRSAFQSI